MKNIENEKNQTIQIQSSGKSKTKRNFGELSEENKKKMLQASAIKSLSES